MKLKTLALTAALLAAGSAQAVVIGQWNFNDSNLAVDLGAGSASYVGGTTLSGFNAGSTLSDPAPAGSDFAWNISSFAPQGTQDKQRGVQFAFNTVGYDSLVFSFDQRHSNTSAQQAVVQISVDNGGSFLDVGSFQAAAGDTWYARSVDLSPFSGAANNANLLVRVVASFSNGSSYLPSNPASTYGTTSTYRFDMVTLEGNVAAVPEPQTYALLLAGLGTIGFLARRRKA